jgi:hypothetical protein
MAVSHFRILLLTTFFCFHYYFVCLIGWVTFDVDNRSLRITLTNGQSKSCNSPGCPGAFHQDGNDERYQIQEANNPNSGIKLEFCY